MADFTKIFALIPEVKKPDEKKLAFNVKLKWTLIVLISFFILANISLFGLSNNALERFQYLAIILGTDFGSIISLGIGPIVMASIILQLLTGAGIININTNTVEGKKLFQGIQKLLVFFFIIFEACVYVLMKGLEAMPGYSWLVILQLILGGIAIYYMNELCEKWGFGSGVSIFIAAGASWHLFTQAFQFVNTQGRNCLLDFSGTACSGKVLVLIQSIINKYPVEFASALGALLSTVVIFLLVVWAQSLKVEIPLSFGRIRGYGIKWPLNFFYASVIPVILTAALVANIQLFGGLLENWVGHPTFLGHFSNGQAVSGFAFWLGHTNLLELIIRGGFLPRYLIQGITHIIFYVGLATLFSVFWVKTSGMGAKEQAQKISASGLQISGFRQDVRVLESVLDRYIMPLTVMGGAAIGLLTATTDLLGALSSGTAILLVIMIMYQFYQKIAEQHMTDMNPAMRKFISNN
ncbi:MAG TPA: preprotein translocase subunit SecY [Candidatus Pacearchaeota archaeon]|nr:preprotein translocase subunit SecY [Candidatus Pacearchaeota archaeon]HOR52248.1 preprotein translocase subunit SecY [Candidatus Pacearchaeota archaeon]HOU79431.1 preprotein translocase subunit SecY [Candidatus Pacearchaeota archaeon]HQF83082.1 preprotein translocase subunit SecY [Candidatus Pacearchaeota archaeon]HQI57890.1 preprotein translocase subunit SecY [Candidatus Pacearchaeota archaeon]